MSALAAPGQGGSCPAGTAGGPIVTMPSSSLLRARVCPHILSSPASAITANNLAHHWLWRAKHGQRLFPGQFPDVPHSQIALPTFWAVLPRDASLGRPADWFTGKRPAEKALGEI